MLNSSTNNFANRRPGGGGRPGGGRSHREPRPVSEFEERVIEVNRVTRVVKGGKRMRFRALVVIGDRKGRVSYGLGKATDVTTAVTKAVTSAKKDMLKVSLTRGTLPYRIIGVHKSAQVLVKPASPGSGLIAGGAARVVLELAGVKDAVAKMLGSSNKISNVMATLDALRNATPRRNLMERRGIAKPAKAAPVETAPVAEVESN